MTNEISENLLGLIFGQALSDAVGRYTEFMYEEQVLKKYPSRKDFIFPPHDYNIIQRSIPKCHWTDDTDQLILIMEMLIETKNKVDINLFANKLYNWVQNGRHELGYNHGIGVGNMTYSIVNSDSFLCDPIKASKKGWQGFLAPNGSIMRTSIMAYRNKPYEETISDAILLGISTHYDPRCCIAVSVVVSILHDIINNVNDDLILERAKLFCFKYKGGFKKFGDKNETTYEEEALKYFNMKTLQEMDLNNQIGYCFKAMSCALYAFRNRHREFKEVILDIILCGGDADTNASSAGAILGCYKGFSKLPNEWLDEMPHNTWLLNKVKEYSEII